jgi:hypothetical protein
LFEDLKQKCILKHALEKKIKIKNLIQVWKMMVARKWFSMFHVAFIMNYEVS